LRLAGLRGGRADRSATNLIQPFSDHAIKGIEPYLFGIDPVSLSLELGGSQPGNVFGRGITEAAARDSLQQIAEPDISEVIRSRICKAAAKSPDQIEYSHIQEILWGRISEPSGVPPYYIFKSCPDGVGHCRIDNGTGPAGKQLKTRTDPVCNRRVDDGAGSPCEHFEGSPDRVRHGGINDGAGPPREEFETGSNPISDGRINNGTWSAGERFEGAGANHVRGCRVARLVARPSQERFDDIIAPGLEFL